MTDPASMAGDMVERVARALYDLEPLALIRPGEMRPITWDEVSAASRARFLNRARAAIAAMRSRTLVCRHDGQVVHELRGAPDDIWKTLLDTALSQQAALPDGGGEGSEP